MKNILKRLYIKRPKNLKDIFQVYLKRIYKYFISDLLFFIFNWCIDKYHFSSFFNR